MIANLAFHIAPFLCLSGAALLVPKRDTPRDLFYGWLQSRGVSDATNVELERAGEQFEPHGKTRANKRIPCGDILAIYLNSRENRRLANEERVSLNSPECEMYLSGICRDHEMIKGAVVFSLVESALGKLNAGRNPLYSGDLLWYYAEEQEFISHLAAHCAEPKRKILLSRL